MTEELIHQIDEWLTQNRPDYYALLQPGASSELLDTFEGQFKLKLPTAFRLLYQWRDGQSQDSFDPLLFNLTFMPLKTVFEHKQMLDGMIGTEFNDPDWWRRDWVPILENGGGDYMCLDLGGFQTGKAGQLLWHDHEDAEREIVHPDIDDFLNDLIQRMKTGTLELD